MILSQGKDRDSGKPLVLVGLTTAELVQLAAGRTCEQRNDPKLVVMVVSGPTDKDIVDGLRQKGWLDPKAVVIDPSQMN